LFRQWYPWLAVPNVIVPQAPVHIDPLTVYETRLEITETKDHGEIRRPVVEVKAVVERRVSHFLMGMATWGTMTGPLPTVVHLVPAAVFVVGVNTRHHYHLSPIPYPLLRHELTNKHTVGLHRVQRHSSQICLPELRTALLTVVQPARIRPYIEDLAFRWRSDLCCRMHGSRFADDRCSWFLIANHRPHTAPHILDAVPVH
jgi:hypothetical protein